MSSYGNAYSRKETFKIAANALTSTCQFYIAELTAEKTAGVCSSAGAQPIGVIISQNDSNTKAQTLITSGIARVYANDTITAGAVVATDASGRAIPFATTSSNILGLARNCSDDTGTMIEVEINPMYTAS